MAVVLAAVDAVVVFVVTAVLLLALVVIHGRRMSVGVKAWPFREHNTHRSIALSLILLVIIFMVCQEPKKCPIGNTASYCSYCTNSCELHSNGPFKSRSKPPKYGRHCTTGTLVGGAELPEYIGIDLHKASANK